MNEMDRRAFGKTTAAALIVGSTTGAVSSDARAESPTMKVGKHLYKSLKWKMIRTSGTTREKFQLLKELGYDGVELDSPGSVDMREARDASRELGLPIEGIVNSTHWKIRHSDPDPAVRAEALRNMRRAMHDAQFVGADSVLLVPGKVTDPENENHDQVWERSFADIMSLLPLAEKLQVRILIENVGNGFCYEPKLLAQYIDAFDSPWVGVHFDIGNHIFVSPPAEWIRTLGLRIRKLDIKDRTKARENTKIGEGDADWVDVRKALNEVGYQGWAAAEVRGGDRDRLVEILERMNQVVGRSDGRPAKRLPGATKAIES